MNKVRKINRFFNERPKLRYHIYMQFIVQPLIIMAMFRSHLPERFVGMGSPIMLVSYGALGIMVMEIYRKVFINDDKEKK